MRRSLQFLMGFGILISAVSHPATMSGQDASAETGDVDLSVQLRERADGVTVAIQVDDRTVKQPLNETPLFRYHDARREILDAALWGYGTKGRPAALMKTEAYKVETGEKWVFCFASLSDQIVSASWADGATYQATRPGLELRDLPGAPRPAPSANLRLIQIKRLTERFSAEIQNAEDDREPMRLMPTPICRYDNPEAGLIDGAVFGYTMGTNPDVVLVIELHEEDGAKQWRCGAAGMTSAGFTLRLDQSEVLRQEWDQHVAGRPQEFDRWMWRRVIEP